LALLVLCILVHEFDYFLGREEQGLNHLLPNEIQTRNHRDEFGVLPVVRDELRRLDHGDGGGLRSLKIELFGVEGRSANIFFVGGRVMAGLLADGVVVVRVRAPIRNLLDLVLEGKSVCVFQTAVMVGGLVRRQIVLQFLFLGLCFAEERFDQLPHNALVAHLIAARLC
jgi:hypothetical protein